MLEKMGKTDLGESAKAMGLVFVIGLVLAIIGGTLGAVSANDTTDYANSDIIEGESITPEQMIGHFHQQGKGLIGLLAFWFPIIGIVMIAIGVTTLHLGTRPFGVALLATGMVSSLILFHDVISMLVMATLYAVSLCSDIASTIRSERFPRKERNIIISVLHHRIGIAKTWVVYGVTYFGVIILGYVFLDGMYAVLAIMTSVHAIAAITNILSEKTQTPYQTMR